VPGSARLIVARTLKNDVRQRQVYIELDGESIATLLVDESVVRDIAPGKHTLRFDNTLVKKTHEFDAAPGDVIEAIPFLALMGVAPLFLSIERVPSTDRR
jgi:hypothetical protein